MWSGVIRAALVRCRGQCMLCDQPRDHLGMRRERAIDDLERDLLAAVIACQIDAAHAAACQWGDDVVLAVPRLPSRTRDRHDLAVDHLDRAVRLRRVVHRHVSAAFAVPRRAIAVTGAVLVAESREDTSHRAVTKLVRRGKLIQHMW
jgi:hypothetical protein